MYMYVYICILYKRICSIYWIYGYILIYMLLVIKQSDFIENFDNLKVKPYRIKSETSKKAKRS